MYAGLRRFRCLEHFSGSFSSSRFESCFFVLKFSNDRIGQGFERNDLPSKRECIG